NGNVGSIYEHNSYCEADGIVYEFNHYGPTKSSAGGNNLKDRSCKCVVRYNWIEAGNRQLDLVEADGSGLNTLAGYNTTYVYGNVLIEPDGAGNSQIIHYGGDGSNQAAFRKGTLHLYNNTIYSTRTGNTTLVRLSTSNETCDCRNNIIHTSAAGSFLALLSDNGTINLRNNWLKTGYVSSHSGSFVGTVNTVSGNLTGSDPGFTNVGAEDFSLAAAGVCVDKGGTLNAAVLPTHNVIQHYVKHTQSAARPADTTLDIGAFEYGTGSGGGGGTSGSIGGSSGGGCTTGPNNFSWLMLLALPLISVLTFKRRRWG
ncbi:MAG: polysaccharide-degrading enzyme, partial [Planctomycetota bacterium]